MKKWMAAIGLVLLLLVGVMPATVKAAAPTLSGSVWVGGVELDSIGDYVESSNGNGGRATLYCEKYFGAPVLVLDNYVYEGNGYEYADGCYAGIYYSGNNIIYIILGSGTSGQASNNSITITAANATESYGIYVDTSYTNNLFIGGNKNEAADTLTVTGGPATVQSSGIKVTDGIKIISTYEDVYTSVDAVTKFYADGNFTVNAIGGTVSGEGAYSAGMNFVLGRGFRGSTFDKGTFYATGGEATNGTSYGIWNQVVNNATDTYSEFTGATVTATGGTGKSGSYGINGKEVTITGGTVTADAGTSTGGTGSTSTGIYCTTLNVSGGTVNATGGTAEGYSTPTSYGINCSGDATFSGGKITATGGKASYEIDSNNTVLQHEAKTYGIYADTMTISGAEVTATGETCGGNVPGAVRNLRYSYGCYGNITMTDGSLIAIGGNLLMEDTTTGGRYSYGIYGGITATSGTIGATGGNTVGGESYGIYLNKDSSFSGEAVVTATTKTESTDDYRYAIYAKEPQSVADMTLTVADSASVTANVAEEARLGTSGIYVYSSYITFIQTGGTVVASAPTKDANQAGARFMKAEISGGTFSASAKGTAFYAYDLNLTGGDITGTSTSTLEDTMNVESTGIKIQTLTMTGGSLTGEGGKHTTLHSYGVYLTGTADVSGGTITGTGGHVYSKTLGVMSYGVNIDGTLTLSGGTVKGTAGQASSTSEGVYIKNAILSNSAQIVGQGGISDRDNSVGVSINDASVSDTVTITGNGGQATGPSVGVYFAKADFNDSAQIVGQGGTSNDDSIGVSFGSSITMGAESEAQVTGNGGSGANSMGIKFDGSTLSLLGGSLTATGGTGTTASYGLYTTNNFLMDGTLLTAKGNTSAVGCNSSKEISSDVIVVSTDIAGTNPSPLQYGGHAISTLAEYKYLKAGTTSEVGAEPGKRDISGATITLASSSLTYDGTEQTMTVTSVKLGSVELLDEVTISGNKATDAGTYTLTVTAKDDSYYTGSVEKPFTVNPLKITPDVTVTGGPYAYKSTVDSSAVTVKHGEIVLELNVDYTVEIYTTTVGENGGMLTFILLIVAATIHLIV